MTGLVLAAVAATLCLFGQQATILAVMGSLVFVSTALLSLPGLGGASLTVPQFGLVCLAVFCARHRAALPRIADALLHEPACQALVLFTLYAAGSAVLFPHLFEGDTMVFMLARRVEGISTLLPLQPSPGNATQTLYLLGGTAAFLFVTAVIGTPDRLRAFIRGFQFFVVLHVLFGLIDFAGKYVLGKELLSFLRTANYAMVEAEVLGFHRLVGSYPESSSFAAASAAHLAFCFAAWQAGVKGWLWPALFLALTLLLAYSTSSTGYVFLVLAGTGFALALARQLAGRAIRRTTVKAIAAAALAVAALLGVALVSSEALEPFYDLLDRMLFNKLSSGSAHERFMWNRQSVENLFDTGGIGTGLGSSRSSSWLLVLISQVGVLGAALFALFVACVLFKRNLNAGAGAVPTDLSGSILALKAFMLGALLAASVSGATFDLGLAFYIAAGVVVAASRVRLAGVARPSNGQSVQARPVPNASSNVWARA